MFYPLFRKERETTHTHEQTLDNRSQFQIVGRLKTQLISKITFNLKDMSL